MNESYEVLNMMNVKEVNRLMDWLEAKGMTPDDINDCIRYIGENPRAPGDKEKDSAPATNE